MLPKKSYVNNYFLKIEADGNTNSKIPNLTTNCLKIERLV